MSRSRIRWRCSCKGEKFALVSRAAQDPESVEPTAYLATDIYESEIDILSIPLRHLSLFPCHDLFSSICQKGHPWTIVAEGAQLIEMDPSNLPRCLYCCHDQEHKGY
jgi:hypothetical protein